jgi:hypothetical protein
MHTVSGGLEVVVAVLAQSNNHIHRLTSHVHVEGPLARLDSGDRFRLRQLPTRAVRVNPANA